MRRFAATVLILEASRLLAATPSASSPSASGVRLEVPVVRQTRERCGPAALEMVLRYYQADSAQVAEAARAYDPALRGALITDLAAAARRAGFEAAIAAWSPDSLVASLEAGTPPIVLFQKGGRLLTAKHYGVITAWDPAKAAFTLNDGEARPRILSRNELAKRWRTAGSQALVVRRKSP